MFDNPTSSDNKTLQILLTSTLGDSIMMMTIKLGKRNGGKVMNKEEILDKSRQENRNRDLAEIDCLKKSSVIAYIVGCCVCMTLSILQWSFTKTVNWGCWVANFSILGTVFLVKFINLRKTHELLMTIFYYVLCIFFLIGFVMSMRG